MKNLEKHIGSVLYVTAEASLQKEIDEELKIADPLEDAESSIKGLKIMEEDENED